jgi:Adenylate and Guanylate cyclase catalytic domain
MDFYEMLDQVVDLLRSRQRVAYRTLKRQFDLDDAALEDLKAEIFFAHPQIADVDGQGLGWTVATPGVPHSTDMPALEPARAPLTSTPALGPIAYTPRHLAERILAEQAALEARGAPDGERKTITALFADIKGSMALLEEVDPEDARGIIDPALTLMMDAVHRYEGYVAQSLGDGIFALFGAPIAHEDHAHRALYGVST